MSTLKKFSLIELIVVIAVLGILAAIVVPNISSVKEKAVAVRVEADQTQLQKAVDVYRLDHDGKLPVDTLPELGKPVYLDVSKLAPDYARELQKITDIKYWIDSDGTVWASRVESPENIRVEGNELKWDQVDSSQIYYVYEKSGSSTGYVNVPKLKFIGETSEHAFSIDTTKTYFVSAVDANGHQSPPTTTGYVRPEKPQQGNWLKLSEEKVDLQSDIKSKWTEVTYDSDIPKGTRVVFTYQTSNDNVNWSEPVTKLTDTTEAYYLRVNYSYEKLSTSNDTPSIRNLIGKQEEAWVQVPGDKVEFQGSLKLKWANVTYDSQLPEGTKLKLSYQSSDDKNTWSSEVSRLEDLPASYYLRVNYAFEKWSSVIATPTISNIKGIQEVVWRSLGTSELLFSGTNAKWTSVTYATNIPANTKLTVTYQTSNDQITWSASSSDVTTLPAGKYLKVITAKESLSSTTAVPTISNIQVKQGTTVQNVVKKFNEKLNYAAYSKILYVNATTGLDTNNGTQSAPLKTFDKAYQTAVAGTKTLIVLDAGTYTASTSIYTKQDVDVVGKNQNTHLVFNAPYGRPDPSGNGYVVFQKDMSFYNMVIETRGTTTYANYFYVHGGHVAFYNVVFDNFFNLDYTDFITYNDSGTYFFNTTTTASGHKNFTLRSEGNASLNVIQNAYGYIELDTTYGYAIDPSLLKDSKISTAPKLDANFNITESGWQNIGLGANPDGSRASAGVYGGPNAWQ